MNYSTPYVFPALNGNLPNIGDTFLRRVTEEVHRKVQAPIPMTILTAIHAASAGFQHRVKVELHHGKVVPIGTYGINVAKSTLSTRFDLTVTIICLKNTEEYHF